MKYTLKSMSALAATLIIHGSLAGGANAAVTITFNEVGSSVIATVSGSANLAALIGVATNVPVIFVGESSVYANPVFLGIGGSSSFDPYGTISGPASIGSGIIQIAATSTSGDFVGIGNGTGTGNPPVDLWLPASYSSGSPLSGSSTWTGQSLSTLGIDPGVYVWSWGSGSSADTLTLDVIPEPSSALLLGLGTIGFLATNRRRIK